MCALQEHDLGFFMHVRVGERVAREVQRMANFGCGHDDTTTNQCCVTRKSASGCAGGARASRGHEPGSGHTLDYHTPTPGLQVALGSRAGPQFAPRQAARAGARYTAVSGETQPRLEQGTGRGRRGCRRHWELGRAHWANERATARGSRGSKHPGTRESRRCAGCCGPRRSHRAPVCWG
jgi:hypothetical protein